MPILCCASLPAVLPSVAVDAEVRDSRVKLLRFSDPVPGRSVGLAWRRTSPRKADFWLFASSAAAQVSYAWGKWLWLALALFSCATLVWQRVRAAVPALPTNSSNGACSVPPRGTFPARP